MTAATESPAGARSLVGESADEGIPRYGDVLMAAVQSSDRLAIGEGFVRFSTLRSRGERARP